MSSSPHIWVPKVKIIEPKKEIAMKSYIKGRYRMVAGKKNGASRVVADWFDNAFSTTGLDGLGSSSMSASTMKVGTGTSAESASLTSLEGLVGTTTNRLSGTFSTFAVSGEYAGWSRTWRFGEGDAAGNLGEVGIGTGTTASVNTRARIRDSLGDPTTITILSDEFLDVTYEMRHYMPTADIEDEIVLGGDTYEYTIRPSCVHVSTRWRLLNADNATSIAMRHDTTTNQTSGLYQDNTLYSNTTAESTITTSTGIANRTSASAATYTNGNYYRDFTLTWGLTAANFTEGVGRGYIGLGLVPGSGVSWASGIYQIYWKDPIPKTDEEVLSLTFRSAWAQKT
jgi:hypothetical protein